MRIFRPSPTHIPNIIKVGHTVPEICSGQKITDGGRRTDIWITKSLPELSSVETRNWLCSDTDNVKTSMYTKNEAVWPIRYREKRVLVCENAILRKTHLKSSSLFFFFFFFFFFLISTHLKSQLMQKCCKMN